MNLEVQQSEPIYQYSLSGSGKPCENPIKDLKHCKKAAAVLANTLQQGLLLSKFVEVSGNGYDLPNGCIAELEKHESGYGFGNLSYVYWNPNGVALSADGHIRTVCYNPKTSFDGKNRFGNEYPNLGLNEKLHLRN